MKKELPINTKKQRLVIYKKVLRLYNKGFSEDKQGLCVNLKQESGRSFMCLFLPETDVLFPEFGRHIKKYTPTKYVSLYKKSEPKWRVKVLENCIKLCNK